MAKFRFRLVEGQHIEADKSKPVLGPDGKPTGRFERKTFKKGDYIDSDTDLAAKLGSNKFELVSGSEYARITELESERANLEREIATLKAQKANASATPADNPPAPVVSRVAPVVGRDLEKEHGGDFAKLSPQQLHEIADAEEIELHGTRDKNEIIKALRKNAKTK